MTAEEIWDRDFLPLRSKILEIAATLDRFDRAGGAETTSTKHSNKRSPCCSTAKSTAPNACNCSSAASTKRGGGSSWRFSVSYDGLLSPSRFRCEFPTG